MKKLAIAMLLAGSTALMADGAAAYAKCVGCHGANGEKAALGDSLSQLRLSLYVAQPAPALGKQKFYPSQFRPRLSRRFYL